jgi:hypothetical protein
VITVQFVRDIKEEEEEEERESSKLSEDDSESSSINGQESKRSDFSMKNL